MNSEKERSEQADIGEDAMDDTRATDENDGQPNECPSWWGSDYANTMVTTPHGPETLEYVLQEMANKEFNRVGRMYPLDEVGISRLFFGVHQREIRYVSEKKCWYFFNGKFWEEDNGRVMELCKQFVEIAYRIIMDEINDPKLDSTYPKPPLLVRNLANRRTREIILKDAASIEPVSMSDFDQNPYLLNCINGTYDLKNHVLLEHNPLDLITKIAGVAYDPAATCPRWEQHIMEVMENDVEAAEFLQKSFGYSLLGKNMLERFWIFYGPSTRNGKTTTLETVKTMLGGYGETTSPETIAQQQATNANAASGAIARLAGARMVSVPEPDKSMTISASTMKTLTGNNRITARYNYQEFFEFTVVAKFFVDTNHLPNITDPTLFLSDRVIVVPFEHYFDETSRDADLKSELIAPESLSGVLNWCIEGLKAVQKVGLTKWLKLPPSVQNATEQYKHDSDKITLFMGECLAQDAGAKVRFEDAYRLYKQWCTTNGLCPEGSPKFKKSLENHRVKFGRSRINGSANAVSCILDYSLAVSGSASNGTGISPATQVAVITPAMAQELRRYGLTVRRHDGDCPA